MVRPHRDEQQPLLQQSDQIPYQSSYASISENDVVCLFTSSIFFLNAIIVNGKGGNCFVFGAINNPVSVTHHKVTDSTIHKIRIAINRIVQI